MSLAIALGSGEFTVISQILALILILFALNSSLFL